MAQINKPSLHFNTKLYTGNGSTQSITGVGFQPDWVWTKRRDSSDWHVLTDSVRGANKSIFSNLTNTESTDTNVLTSFDSDGFSIGDNGMINASSGTFASWNWKANGAGSANSDGSQSSTVSVNTTAGFSIVKFTNTTSYSSNTFGHGLGVAPQMIIMRSLDDAYNWDVYHYKVGETKRLVLNSTASEASTTYMNNTAPTNQVFTLASNHYSNGSNCIAYCFTSKKSFSKLGSYSGNGQPSGGTFVYCGFKPAFVMLKVSNATSGSDFTGNWNIYDNKRGGETYNPSTYRLLPNSTNADASSSVQAIDFLSNGFKLYSGNTDQNSSAGAYIYMAFAEEPLVGSNNVPATAR